MRGGAPAAHGSLLANETMRAIRQGEDKPRPYYATRIEGEDKPQRVRTRGEGEDKPQRVRTRGEGYATRERPDTAVHTKEDGLSSLWRRGNITFHSIASVIRQQSPIYSPYAHDAN